MFTDQLSNSQEKAPSKLRRYAAWGVVTGCLVGATILAGAMAVPRSYEIRSDLDRRVVTGDAVGSTILDQLSAGWMDRVRNIAVAAMGQRQADNIVMSQEASGAGRDRLELTMVSNNPESSGAGLSAVLAEYAIQAQKEAARLVREKRTEWQAKLTLADGQEKTLSDQLRAFEAANPGVLPDDPTSVVTKLDRTSSRLDELQLRLHEIDQQVTALQGKASGTPAKNPTPAATPSATPTPAIADPTSDPEVVQLKAQVALINEQLDEQTTTMHRTEQHPYVIELRTRQADLQKKLDAATARALAGKPPPPEIKNAVIPGLNAAFDSIDTQLLTLQSQRSAIAAEVATITKDRDTLQKAADGVLPLRRKYAAMQQSLDQIQKDKAQTRAALTAFEERFFPARTHDSSGDPTSLIEFGKPTVSGDSTAVFPRFWQVLTAASFMGLLAGVATTGIRSGMDRSFHEASELRGSLGVPILGVIHEHSQTGRARSGGVRIVKAAAVVASIVILLGAGLYCYAGLGRGIVDVAAWRGGT